MAENRENTNSTHTDGVPCFIHFPDHSATLIAIAKPGLLALAHCEQLSGKATQLPLSALRLPDVLESVNPTGVHCVVAMC